MSSREGSGSSYDPRTVNVEVKNTFLEFGRDSEDDVLPAYLSRRRTTMTRVRRSGVSDRRVSFCPQVPVFFYNQESENGDGGEWFDGGASDSDTSDSDSDAEEASVDAETTPASVAEELRDTTVMIRNIPNKYTQRRMLDVLRDPANGVGLIDYLYMPMDLRHKCNVGYGFINFRRPVDALDFINRFCGFQLPDTNSKKIFEVTFAKTQGLAANIHEVKSRGASSTRPIPEEYKPMFFDADMNFIPMPDIC